MQSYFYIKRNDNHLNITVNWDYILGLDVFKSLCVTPQSPKWHSEGEYVIDHVRLCIEKAIAYFTHPKYHDDFDDSAIETILLAVLFHDVGKAFTTVLGSDGLYHNHNHANVGERITREYLWDLGYFKREYICKLVKYHMLPLDVINDERWLEKMFNLAKECGGLRNLSMVKMFDLQGCVPTVDGAIEKNFDDIYRFIQTAKLLDIYEKSPSLGPRNRIRGRYSSKKKLDVYVLIGLPGSGKSTWVKDNDIDNSVVISRDLIRVELGYCKDDEKFIGNTEQENVVTEMFNQRMVDCASEGKTLILDNMNNRREYRDGYKKLLTDYDVNWIYVYCEAPTLDVNIYRRQGQIPGDSFRNMVNRFDMPHYSEYDKLIIKISN